MPVRPISIPRLELQAVTLSARTYQVCREKLTYNIDRVVFWTDSQTSLQYIKNESKRFHTYVTNRIAEIRDNQSRPMETLPRKIESSRQCFLWFEAPEIDRSALLVEGTRVSLGIGRELA